MMPVLSLINLAAVVLLLVALKWDRDDRTKQLERMKSELEQIQSRVNAARRAADERQKQAREKQGREKQPAPEKATPAASGQKSGRLDALLAPFAFS